MKIGRFCNHLGALASSLEDERLTSAVRALTLGLKPFASRDTDALFAIELNNCDAAGEPSFAIFQRRLSPFSRFILEISATAPKRAFNSFFRIVNEHPRMAIREYLAAISGAFAPGAPVVEHEGSLVDAYVKALRKNLHDDDEFPKTFGALIDDPRLGKDDVVAIASEFAFRMAKSTSRKVALERIWKMHDASQAYTAKVRAMKGQSAA